MASQMMKHDLKIWPENFFPLCEGKKTCEVRINDRHYRVGDVLLLRCYDPQTKEYNGMSVERLVTWINHVPNSEYVALSIQSEEREA